MHGIVYFLLQQFVESNWDNATWSSMFDSAGLDRKAYLPTEVYPDAEILALVEAGANVAHVSQEEVLASFGRFLAPNLLAIHGALLQPEWRTLATILNTEEVMHAMVRQSKPGAQPPVLKCVQGDDDTLQVIYTSPRKLCPLAKGIMQGIADHFKESIKIEDQSCMLKGDLFCSMSVAVIDPTRETNHTNVDWSTPMQVRGQKATKPERLGDYLLQDLVGGTHEFFSTQAVYRLDGIPQGGPDRHGFTTELNTEIEYFRYVGGFLLPEPEHPDGRLQHGIGHEFGPLGTPDVGGDIGFADAAQNIGDLF